METGRTISLTQEQKTGVSKTAKLKEMRRGYDSLTGMMGRRLFLLKTQQMLHQHPDLQFVMVRADMDHFRVYNSFFGVAAGDELLRRIADFVRQFTAHLDICTYGHIGADVFCVCCPYREGLLEASIEKSCRTVQGLNPNYYLRANYGIYLITPGEDDMERIYTRASEAARYCKRSYNRNYVFYDEKMREAGRWEQWVINEMEGALRTGQFQVYLQPRYLLRSKKPCGLEALVRWQHPTNGLIMPDKFISIFERSGFIIRLDRYMLDQAGGLLRSWLDDGDMVVPISVNISQISLYDPQLVDYLVEVSQQYQLPDGLLQLEVTESAYMSNPEMMGTLIDQLHAHHFTILMDDFGKGYSSLNTLKNIDVDLLKIDMAFLPTGEKNVKSEKILASIIRMASWLNMNVLVEGVETETQEAFLMSVGCKYAQGYYFARPMPVSDWEKVQHSAGAETSTFKDLDAIWSSDETTNSLLNGIAVPFAICMYADRHGEALRRNDAFLNEFGLDWEKTSMVPDEKEKLDDACAWAVERQNTAECECLFAGGNGGTKWFRIKIQYIRQVRDFYVLSLTFSEITDERVLGRQVNQIIQAIQSGGAETMPQSSNGKETILIIDDSELSRDILENLFTEEYNLLLAKDGVDGMQLLQDHINEIAVILLDMVMPRMNGESFLQQKNQMVEAANIPVIVISAERNNDFLTSMLKNGVNDYVTKPFVPELVVRRVKNVIEYNSRFRKLMQEYKQMDSVDVIPGMKDKEKNYFTVSGIYSMMGYIGQIFDIVRLVDPEKMQVLELDEESGEIVRSAYQCFKVWKKEERCANCTSQCAMQSGCTMTKYEFIENDIFYVLSQPLHVTQPDGSVLNCVLEIVSHVSDHLLNHGSQGRSVQDVLADIQRKIYIDSLTGVYNRRFFDEMMFLHHQHQEQVESLTLILFDMQHFKFINDTYGHLVGDQVLHGVAQAVQAQTRSDDSVIRYGGDEFVVMLTNCSEDAVKNKIDSLKKAVQTVRYGNAAEYQAAAEFGYAYAPHFERRSERLREMFRQADQMVYENKALLKAKAGMRK